MATYAPARWDHDHVHIGTPVATALQADVRVTALNQTSHDKGWYPVIFNPTTQEWEPLS